MWIEKKNMRKSLLGKNYRFYVTSRKFFKMELTDFGNELFVCYYFLQINY